MPENVGITVRPDKVAVITFSSPPVNALSLNLRRLLALNVANTMADRRVQAVVLRGERGVFSGGADIREFGELLSSNLGMTEADTELFRTALETGPKPTVACVEGLALGGGCELALACNARVASSKAQLGLPELKLGLIPGLGGTQRLPRLVGVERALDLMLTSKMVAAEEALELGLVDAISAPDAVLERACQLALQMVTGKRPVASLAPAACRETARAHRATAVRSVCVGGAGRAGAERRHGRLAARGGAVRPVCRIRGIQSAHHVFFASRGNAGPMERSVVAAPRRVAVIGGGLMGSGIATAILEHGGEVLLKEVNQEALQAAYARIQRNLSRRSRDAEQLMRTQLHGTAEWVPEQFRTAELVIEAAVEDVPAKQGIFRELVQCTGADCVLATNTSTINLDLIGEAVPEAHAAGAGGAHRAALGAVGVGAGQTDQEDAHRGRQLCGLCGQPYVFPGDAGGDFRGRAPRRAPVRHRCGVRTGARLADGTVPAGGSGGAGRRRLGGPPAGGRAEGAEIRRRLLSVCGQGRSRPAGSRSAGSAAAPKDSVDVDADAGGAGADGDAPGGERGHAGVGRAGGTAGSRLGHRLGDGLRLSGVPRRDPVLGAARARRAAICVAQAERMGSDVPGPVPRVCALVRPDARCCGNAVGRPAAAG
eukprot:ctg_467.g125